METPGWKFVHIGFEGDEVLVGGHNVWKYSWVSTGEPYIIVPHPSYPQQRHEMAVYWLETPDGRFKFAAGEFSNSVWGIYVPE